MRFYRDEIGDLNLELFGLRFLFIGWRDWFPVTSWSIRPMLWIDLGFVLITDRDTYLVDELDW